MAKKGLHWLAWVGIGCAVLVVGGMVAMGGLAWFAGTKIKDTVNEISENPVTFAAKAVALSNPDIEFVSADEDSQVVVFKNSKTNDEYEVSFEDIKAGRVEFKGPDGTVEIATGEGADGGMTVTTDEGVTQFGAAARTADLPEWVPTPPGASVEVQFSQNSGSSSAGAFQVKGLAADEVIEFYRSALEEAGFELTSQDISGGGATLRTLNGRDDQGRQVSVVAQADGIVVSFSNS